MSSFCEDRQCGPYILGRTLGSGMSGKVKLGTHSIHKDQVALKCIDRSSLNDRQYKNLEREITAMRGIEHPNVLRLYDLDVRSAVFLCVFSIGDVALPIQFLLHLNIFAISNTCR